MFDALSGMIGLMASLDEEGRKEAANLMREWFEGWEYPQDVQEILRGIYCDTRTVLLNPDWRCRVGQEKKIASPVEHRFDLIDPDALLAMANVMFEGAKDHAPEGWRNMSVDDILNHALIHIITHMTGTDDGEDHLANAMTRLMMAWAAKERDKRLAYARVEEEREEDRKNQVEVIYLSYPYADDPEMRTKVAIKLARRISTLYTLSETKHVIIVPHVSFATLFDENTERELGLAMCVLAVGLCTRMIVAGPLVSNGMEMEIQEAERLGVPTEAMSDEEEKAAVLNEMGGRREWPPGSDPALVVGPAPAKTRADTDGKPRVPRRPPPPSQDQLPLSCGSCNSYRKGQRDLLTNSFYAECTVLGKRVGEDPQLPPPDWCPKRKGASFVCNETA